MRKPLVCTELVPRDMALSPSHTLPDFGDLHLAMEEFVQLLASPTSEGTKSQAAEAPATAADDSGLSLQEGQGHCPLTSEEYLSLLDDLLEGLGEERAAEDEPCPGGPCAPLEQVPSLAPTEMQTCAEALPAGDTAAPAALPAAPSADAEHDQGRCDAVGPAKTKRRAWVRFSPYQRQALTARFKANRSPDAEDMEALAAQLDLTTTQVQNWFRNERKKYNKWFAHLLEGEQGADPQPLHHLTQGMSSRTAPGSMARRLLKE